MLYRRGRTWWYKFRFAGQEIRETAKTSNKAVARDAERVRRRELEEGFNGIRRRARTLLFSRAAKAWLAAHRHQWAPNTAVLYAGSFSHLKPFFGAQLLVDISGEDIRYYQARRLKAGAAGRTVNIETGVLRQVLRQHKLWARLADDVRALKERRNAGRALSPEEEKNLLAAAASPRYSDSPLYAIVVLGLNTALRKGEILALCWGDVDLTARTLSIRRGKTEAAVRVVPLNNAAGTVLEFWGERFPERTPANFVFPANHNHHTDPSRALRSFRTAWRNALKDAKLRGLRFHDLRHSTITKLSEGQASDQTIMAIAGHVSREMLEHYSHIRMEAKRAAVENIAQPEIDRGWVQNWAQSGARAGRQVQ